MIGGGSDGLVWTDSRSTGGSNPPGRLPHGSLAALAEEAPTKNTDINIHTTNTPELPPFRASEGLLILSFIAAYPWPYAEAIAVARCENRNLGPTIISNTNDYGIFQINEIHAWRVEGDIMQLLIPEVNVRVAYEIYVDNGGWVPWRSSRGCHGFG